MGEASAPALRRSPDALHSSWRCDCACGCARSVHLLACRPNLSSLTSTPPPCPHCPALQCFVCKREGKENVEVFK